MVKVRVTVFDKFAENPKEEVRVHDADTFEISSEKGHLLLDKDNVTVVIYAGGCWDLVELIDE